jgi:hypothetical protein
VRCVRIVAFPDFQRLDLSGPSEEFGRTTRRLAGRGSAGGAPLERAAGRRGRARSSSGFSLAVPRPLDAPVGAGRARTKRAPRRGGDRLREGRRARRTASVYSGAFLRTLRGGPAA